MVNNSGQDPTSDLTNTLARLDQQWEIQRRSNKSPTSPSSRWTKLVLPPPAADETDSTVSAAAAAENDFVYLLEPPNKSIPSCLIVFTGGAGLGTYPQIAYNEFLFRLSNRLNAAVLTAPYQVGLDHFALAKETGDRCRRAMILCQDNEDNNNTTATNGARRFPAGLPVFAVAHSLGAKLACIYTAATGPAFVQGLGLISYNNFSFGRTIGMAKEFAATLRDNVGRSGSSNSNGRSSSTDEMLDTIFSFAEMAVSAVGIDFSPTAADMDRLIQLKFTSELQQKTRLFTFDNDRLENTPDFLQACTAAGGGGPTVSGLPGTHLTPVYFKLGLDDILSDEYNDSARDMAREAVGGLESASFGDEGELTALVDEVSNWILGQSPSRKPTWLRERPQIAAAETK